MNSITKFLLFFLFVVCAFCGYSQIPVNQIRKEILQLKDSADIENYWTNIRYTDQQAINQFNPAEYDSIMQVNLIKISLLIDLHGADKLNINNSVPIIALTHNNIPSSAIQFWCYGLRCFESINQKREELSIPPIFELSYPYESLFLTVYDKSILLENTDSLISVAQQKLTKYESRHIGKKLAKDYEKLKQVRKFKTVNTIGTWKRIQLEGNIEKEEFSIILKENKQYYIEYKNQDLTYYRQLEKKTSAEENTFIYADNFMDWELEILNDSQLALKNDFKQTILVYPR